MNSSLSTGQAEGAHEELRRLRSSLKWGGVIAAIFAIDAVRMAWGEHRFVGAFFESLVADFIFIGIPILALVFGVFAGAKAFDATNSKLWAVVVGVLVFGAIGSIYEFSGYIPGVGWRVQALHEAHQLAEELN